MMANAETAGEAAPRRVGRPPLVDNRRGSILETAALLFGQMGYDKCSMQDISEHTKISKAALYHYFESKREIYDAIYMDTLTGLVDYVAGEIPAKATPREKFTALFAAHATYFEQHFWAFSATMIGTAGTRSMRMRDEALAVKHRYEEMLKDIVREGLKSGAFAGVEADAAGRAALSILYWMPRWYHPASREEAVKTALGFCDLLLDGMGKK